MILCLGGVSLDLEQQSYTRLHMQVVVKSSTAGHYLCTDGTLLEMSGSPPAVGKLNRDELYESGRAEYRCNHVGNLAG